MFASALQCFSDVELANAGHHCSIYSLAADRGLTLVPRLGGSAWIGGGCCFYDATANLAAQAADVCGALAMAEYPNDATSRALLRAALLQRCLSSLGDLATRA